MPAIEPFSAAPDVRGFLHRPARPTGEGIVLSHGASGNANVAMLVAVADFLAENGFLALRIDLPYRQRRPNGPPGPSTAAMDQEGIRHAAECLRNLGATSVVLAGHSYGGRMTSMLAAAQPAVAERLLLMSYPLHPPGKAAEKRVAHLPDIQVPTVFVHGAKDPFGSIEEMREAVALIPAPTRLIEVEKAGHSLTAGSRKSAPAFFAELLESLRHFGRSATMH